MCSNTSCTEINPQYYTDAKSGKCKACKRAYQRSYRLTPRGRLSHSAHRHSAKGKEGVKKRTQKYYATAKGVKKRATDYSKRTVNTDTLRAGFMFSQCSSCIEYQGSTCSVIEGAESITVCEVYLDFKHSGEHPLKSCHGEWDDYPYDPDLLENENGASF